MVWLNMVLSQSNDGLSLRIKIFIQIFSNDLKLMPTGLTG